MAKGSKKKAKKDDAGGGEGGKGSKGKKGKQKPKTKADMELAKKRAEQEELERQKRDAELAAIAEKKLEIEQAERSGQLVSSSVCINTYDRWVLGRIERNRKLQEWRTFIACRNIPDFVQLSEVNAYLEYWRCQLEKPNMKTLLKLAPELLQVVDELKEFLQLPEQACSMDMVSELGLLYHDMIVYQQRYLDKCTYAILQDLSDLYDPEVGIFEYLLSIPQITHCLWGNMYQCPDYDGHNFQEVQFQFKIPEDLITVKGVYRLIKTEYDHYSASCMSYFPPAVDNALKRSILEWVEKNDKRSLYKELASPEALASLVDIDKVKSKAGKKKKGKGGKKKGKKGKKKGGKSDTESEYDDETKQLLKEIAEDEKRRKKEEKMAKKKEKAAKKGKGKKGKALSSTDMDTEDTDADMTTTDAEPEKQEKKKKKEKAPKPEPPPEQVAEESDAAAPKETKEERRARRRKEAEEDVEKEFDFQPTEKEDPKKKGKKEQPEEAALRYDDDDDKKKDSDSDSDQEKKKRATVAGGHGHDDDDGKRKAKAGQSKTKSISKSIHDVEATEIDVRASKVGGDDGMGGEGKKKKKKKVEEDDDDIFEEKKVKKTRSKKKSKSTKTIQDDDDEKPKKSKSKKGAGKKKSKKNLSKKASKKKATTTKPSAVSKAGKSRAQVDNEDGDDEEDDGSPKPKKSKIGGGKGGAGDKSKSEGRGRSPAAAKKEADKKGGKKANASKAVSASASKLTTATAKSSTKTLKSKASKGGKKKGDSKSKSKSPKGKGKKKGKGKGKGKKGKGGKSPSRERPKTEAELAKERERKEKAQFIPELHENELNLRMYHILGGTYSFQLLDIPPQPVGRGNWTIHLKEYDCSLKELSFEADFNPPAPIDKDGGAKKTPDEMEREAKRQEEELQKLVLGNVELPDLSSFNKLSPEEEAEKAAKELHESQMAFEAEMNKQFSTLLQYTFHAPKKALWFEPPIPVRWDSVERYWSQDGFYDIKFDERTLQMSFRTAKFGIFGLGHTRWLNLPYQTWELRPQGKNKVLFSLTASMAVLEFIILGDLVCVSNIDNVTNVEEVRDAVLNKFMRPNILIKTLRAHNLDVFPDLDSYAYVDGILTKNYETEDHLYQCMAVAATAFNFQWSRWNLLAGREKLIYQMRERHGTSSPGNYQMVLTTPRKCNRIDCTEVSPNYSEALIEEFEYHADLLNLVRTIGTPEAINIMAHTNPHHVETVRTILTAVRPLTFS